jgi:site-specific DNA-methyltransferase (adenine-specific)
MWCVKVATGAFVARRHGKIFITGNSGFPKSMDVGKAIDKALGAERKKVPNPLAKKQTASIGTNAYGDYNATTEIAPEPVTDQAKEWDGWGTCLKPAWEPIIVARKPLDGTVAHNVMTYGTGAINIDGCRVPTSDKLGGGMHGGVSEAWDRPWMHDEQAQAEFVERKKASVAKGESLGRFPANLVHDGSQEVLELFPDTGRSSGGGMHAKGVGSNNATNAYGAYIGGSPTKSVGFGDTGSAARFFYCAKASKKDRGEGNDHPTVKPNALMRWLVRLVCPQGGIVLDPFMGSGSTGVACIQEGMRFVGVDMDEHYCEIAEKRIGAEPDTVFAEVYGQ